MKKGKQKSALLGKLELQKRLIKKSAALEKSKRELKLETSLRLARICSRAFVRMGIRAVLPTFPKLQLHVTFYTAAMNFGKVWLYPCLTPQRGLAPPTPRYMRFVPRRVSAARTCIARDC